MRKTIGTLALAGMALACGDDVDMSKFDLSDYCLPSENCEFAKVEYYGKSHGEDYVTVSFENGNSADIGLRPLELNSFQSNHRIGSYTVVMPRGDGYMIVDQ